MDNTQEKTRRLRVWFWIYLVAGVLGLLDIASKGNVPGFENSDWGLVTFALALPFGWLGGPRTMAVVGTVLQLLLSFSIIWLALAGATRSFIKKREKGERRAV